MKEGDLKRTTERGALAVFTGLPNELLLEVFWHFLFTGAEFVGDVDYEDECCPGGLLCSRLSVFAGAVVGANRAFYEQGTRLLWRLVIVRTPRQLQELVSSCREGGVDSWKGNLGTVTRRLDLRLQAAYNGQTLAELFACLPNVITFVDRSSADMTAPTFSPDFGHLAKALGDHFPLLECLQFEADVGVPDVQGLMMVLASHPRVKVLRTARVDWTRGQVQALIPRKPVEGDVALECLSLGTAHSIYRADLSPLHDLLEELSTTWPLASLQALHMFQDPPRKDDFLSTHGNRLGSLLMVAPGRHDRQASGWDWLGHCPNVRELVWVVKGWHTVEPPALLPNVRSLKIVYVKSWVERDELCVEHLKDCLRQLGGDSYNNLEKAEVALRGEGDLPDLGEITWFRECMIRADDRKWVLTMPARGSTKEYISMGVS